MKKKLPDKMQLKHIDTSTVLQAAWDAKVRMGGTEGLLARLVGKWPTKLLFLKLDDLLKKKLIFINRHDDRNNYQSPRLFTKNWSKKRFVYNTLYITELGEAYLNRKKSSFSDKQKIRDLTEELRLFNIRCADMRQEVDAIRANNIQKRKEYESAVKQLSDAYPERVRQGIEQGIESTPLTKILKIKLCRWLDSVGIVVK